jgi:hypothetical protein
VFHIQKERAMKKKLKKQIKAKKEVKKAMSPIQDLKQRNMRLTQELDRLSTTVANHNTLLFHIHQALMTEKIMSYQPDQAIDPISGKPQGFPVAAPGEKNPPAFFANMRGQIKYYTVSVMLQQTTIGHLTLDGQLTFDPALIGKFETKDRIPGPLQKASMPEGAKTHIEAHWQ